MSPKESSPYPDFKYLRYWIKDFGRAGQLDQKAAQDFLIVEPDHVIKGLRAELYSVLKGNFEESTLDDIVTKKRKVKHGSYQEWAKLMLLWIYKRGA